MFVEEIHVKREEETKTCICEHDGGQRSKVVFVVANPKSAISSTLPTLFTILDNRWPFFGVIFLFGQNLTLSGLNEEG